MTTPVRTQARSVPRILIIRIDSLASAPAIMVGGSVIGDIILFSTVAAATVRVAYDSRALSGACGPGFGASRVAEKVSRAYLCGCPVRKLAGMVRWVAR